jgi:hypothetical protein
MTKADAKPTKASLSAKRAPTAFTAIPKLASSNVYLFAVDRLGVTTMPKADIGTGKDFLDVATGTPAAGTGVVGADAFAMKTGVANTSVQGVIVSGNYLFIGLDAINDFTGGVAVYEIKPSGTVPVVKAPDIGWRGISVIQLIKDADGTVWAVTSDNILEAKTNGKKGGSYIDTKDAANESSFEKGKSGFKKESFPREGINRAGFVNGKLLISTSKGLAFEKETTVTLHGSKMVDKEE